MNVGFILLPSFTLSVFAGFVDCLRIAADNADRSQQKRCKWSVLSTDIHPLVSSCGVSVVPQGRLGTPARFTHIAVVGGLTAGHARIDPDILDFLRKAHAQGLSILGLCTGSFALAEAGLLQGRRCAVHWYHRQEFSERHPGIEAVSDRLFLVDGRVATCLGGGSSMDLALEVIGESLGPFSARKVMDSLFIPENRLSSLPAMGVRLHLSSQMLSAQVRRAVTFMLNHIGGDITIDAVAADACVSQSTIARRFRNELAASPRQILSELRIGVAKWYLENTRMTISEIGTAVGLASPANFTRSFRAATGLSPRGYRQASGGAIATSVESDLLVVPQIRLAATGEAGSAIRVGGPPAF